MGKHINEQTQKIAAIPQEKKVSKARNTAIGLGSVVLAFVVLKWFVPPCPLWVSGVLLAFGAYSISGDLVRGFAGFVPAVIRDVRAALKGDS